MNYDIFIQSIPTAKRKMLSEKLVNFVLKSKNDEKMPPRLANSILYHCQHETLITDAGLTALLEAAFILEPGKTVNALTQLQLTNIVEQLKEMVKT